MSAVNYLSTSFSDSKKHYEILDGLRGVAALVVVAMHLFETFSMGSHLDMIINHGYLAVDFFFLLSGFVIGYSYDDRWDRMSMGNFFKRRLIRLHPMVIMGMIIGAIGFYFSESAIIFPLVGQVPVWKMLLVMLFGFTLLPLPVPFDIRGWNEMHPLNGPAWSLFFEYVANILYALFIRKFSNTLLTIFVVIAGAALAHLAIAGPNGDVIGGWSLEPTQLRIGFTRLLYPFFAGLLLSRISKPGNIKNAFLWSTLILVVVLSMPRIGGAENLWMNGIYEAVVILIVFPAIVFIGASGSVTGKVASKICTFLGDISYPIYITHYTIIYIFTAWVFNGKVPLAQAWPMMVVCYIASIAIAYVTFRYFDVPVRRWLTNRFMAKKKA